MQYSDGAKTEFRLNAYQDKGTVLSAYQLLPYRGGNTKTGGATPPAPPAASPSLWLFSRARL